jgi:hypothetical protein
VAFICTGIWWLFRASLNSQDAGCVETVWTVTVRMCMFNQSSPVPYSCHCQKVHVQPVIASTLQLSLSARACAASHCQYLTVVTVSTFMCASHCQYLTVATVRHVHVQPVIASTLQLSLPARACLTSHYRYLTVVTASTVGTILILIHSEIWGSYEDVAEDSVFWLVTTCPWALNYTTWIAHGKLKFLYHAVVMFGFLVFSSL